MFLPCGSSNSHVVNRPLHSTRSVSWIMSRAELMRTSASLGFWLFRQVSLPESGGETSQTESQLETTREPGSFELVSEQEPRNWGGEKLAQGMPCCVMRQPGNKPGSTPGLSATKLKNKSFNHPPCVKVNWVPKSMAGLLLPSISATTSQ